MAASNWLLLVIIAKVFGDYSLGEVALSLSVLSPLFLLSSFKLRTLLITDTHNEYPIAQYFHARFIANTVLLLCLPLVCWALLSEIDAIIVILIALYKWCDAWFELNISLRHRLRAFSASAAWLICRALVTVMALALAFLSDNLLLTLILWVCVTATFALLATLKSSALILAHFQQTFSLGIWRWQRLRVSLALFKKYHTLSIALMFSSLFVYLPNLFLQHLQGVSDAGRFAAISYFLVAGSMLITSIAQTAQPLLSRLQAERDYQKLRRTSAVLCALGLAIGLLALLITLGLGPQLLSWVYHPGFIQMADELNWIMAAAMIRYAYIFLGTTLNAFREFAVQTRIAGAGTLAMALSCALLIPSHGTMGAAYAMFIATSLELLLYILFLLRWPPLSKEAINDH
ncbi:polysaccharide biosynthesis protein [Lacimicrobium sp. SS2-24]|uniref:lipopolysaccharide biosynthesis protein n=1 Tax=Lacimicrobium sp. SS2-24 TaxID=2005569 RepID=UPI000B4AE5D6|nr:polysaccharide biosynthesis protein [Lacimicrobium sp. SS2-24]